MARFERMALSLGVCLDPCAVKQRSGPVNAGQYEQAVWILARGNAVPFVGPLTIDAEVKKFLILRGRRLQHTPAHSSRRLSMAGDRAEPRVDRALFFHRHGVAQLFQDQVTVADPLLRG